MNFAAIPRRIVRLGCRPSMQGIERSQVMMVNGLSAAMLLVVSAFVALYIATGVDTWINWLPAYPLLFSVLYLNKVGSLTTGRILFFWGNLALLLAWCFLNRRNGAEYGLIALGITATLVFRRKVSVYFGAISVSIAFLSYKFYDLTTPFIPNPTFDYELIPNLTLGVAVAIVFVEVMAYRSLAVQYYSKLTDKYDTLKRTIYAKRKVEFELNSRNKDLRISNEALNKLTRELDVLVKQKSIQLQSYIDAINVHIYSAVTDITGRIIQVNEPMVNVTGYSHEELIGNNFRVLNSGHHPKEYYSRLYYRILNGEIWRGETKNKAKDGTHFWIDQVILPIRDEHGRLSNFLMLALPITERKEMEEQRTHTLRVFESITHRASHDIRGPLARLMGLSTLLEKDLIHATEIGFVAQNLLQSTHELDTSIHELTDFIRDNQDFFNSHLTEK